MKSSIKNIFILVILSLPAFGFAFSAKQKCNEVIHNAQGICKESALNRNENSAALWDCKAQGGERLENFYAQYFPKTNECRVGKFFIDSKTQKPTRQIGKLFSKRFPYGKTKNFGAIGYDAMLFSAGKINLNSEYTDPEEFNGEYELPERFQEPTPETLKLHRTVSSVIIKPASTKPIRKNEIENSLEWEDLSSEFEEEGFFSDKEETELPHWIK